MRHFVLGLLLSFMGLSLQADEKETPRFEFTAPSGWQYTPITPDSMFHNPLIPELKGALSKKQSKPGQYTPSFFIYEFEQPIADWSVANFTKWAKEKFSHVSTFVKKQGKTKSKVNNGQPIFYTLLQTSEGNDAKVIALYGVQHGPRLLVYLHHNYFDTYPADAKTLLNAVQHFKVKPHARQVATAPSAKNH